MAFTKRADACEIISLISGKISQRMWPTGAKSLSWWKIQRIRTNITAARWSRAIWVMKRHLHLQLASWKHLCGAYGWWKPHPLSVCCDGYRQQTLAQILVLMGLLPEMQIKYFNKVSGLKIATRFAKLQLLVLQCHRKTFSDTISGLTVATLHQSRCRENYNPFHQAGGKKKTSVV